MTVITTTTTANSSSVHIGELSNAREISAIIKYSKKQANRKFKIKTIKCDIKLPYIARYFTLYLFKNSRALKLCIRIVRSV